MTVFSGILEKGLSTGDNERKAPVELCGNEFSIQNCRGEFFRSTFLKLYSIITIQFSRPRTNKSGIKGFVLYGESGTGKTFMAKVLAHELSIPLVFVDGSHIARKYYGESEQRINRVFAVAQDKRCLILFDDAESILLNRRSAIEGDWNLAENNVMFHQLDKLDPSRAVVILTTNMVDLLDRALLDRLYPVAFQQPNIHTTVEIAKHKCQQLGLDHREVVKNIHAKPDLFKSVRDVEKIVQEEYVNHLMRSALETATQNPQVPPPQI